MLSKGAKNVNATEKRKALELNNLKRLESAEKNIEILEGSISELAEMIAFLDGAVCELAEVISAQDMAICELAEMISTIVEGGNE